LGFKVNDVKAEDRAGYYAWCKQAMDEQGRSVNYPAIEDRGYGKCR